MKKPPGRKINHVREPGSRNVDARQGSVLWAYNHYRSRMLTGLLNDLIDLENDGLEESNCRIVQKSLGYFVNASTEIPTGGFFTGTLHSEVEKFETTYKRWNDVNGRDPECIKQRRKLLIELRDKRQKISNKTRRLQFELSTNLDQQILTDCYRAFGDLIKLVPNIFNNLGGAYWDYVKKSGITS